MKRPLQLIITCWMLLTAVWLSSCQKTDPEMNGSSDQMSAETKQDIDFIASLGYDAGEVEKIDNGYLVEGDIWLTSEWLATARQQPQTRLTKHTMFAYLLDKKYQDQLSLNIVGPPSVFWDTPANNAANAWSTLKDCNISIKNGNSTQIEIQFQGKYYFGNSTTKLMKVTPPGFDGGPGRVMLNDECTHFPNTNGLMNDKPTQNKAMYLIMHAIGHALGLGHTTRLGVGTGDDEDWGSSIDSGIPMYDDNEGGVSIMRRETLPFTWTGFSPHDTKYLPKVFPKPDKPALSPGSIEETVTIDQAGGTFSINSKTDATGGAGSIAYIWEKKSGNNWTTVTGKTEKNLSGAPVPTELRSEYRRKVTDGTATAYTKSCIVTNKAYGPLNPGSIEERVLIDTSNSGDTFTITSTQSAVCPRSTVTYTWEITTDGKTWTTIPDATGQSLTAAAPMQGSTTYRRKAVCAHADHDTDRYTNPCKVFNKAFMDGGAIPELIELNKTGFNLRYDVISQRAASIIESGYIWEVYEGNTWKAYGGYGESLFQRTSLERISKYKRRVDTPFGSVYSNECTVINYAYREDPQEGTNWDKMIKLGPYGSDFTEMLAIDTRGAYFRDLDRLNMCGNDAFIELEITREMYVDIITSSYPMNVWLDVWNRVPDGNTYYNNISSGPLAENWFNTDYIPFPGFDDENPDPFTKSVFLRPGKYTIMLQGSKVYNSGCVNEVIGISLRGTTGPEY